MCIQVCETEAVYVFVFTRSYMLLVIHILKDNPHIHFFILPLSISITEHSVLLTEHC